MGPKLWCVCEWYLVFIEEGFHFIGLLISIEGRSNCLDQTSQQEPSSVHLEEGIPVLLHKLPCQLPASGIGRHSGDNKHLVLRTHLFWFSVSYTLSWKSV